MSSDVRKTHTLSPDGKTVTPKKKRFNVSKEIRLKKKSKIKVRAVQGYRP